mmetsp:Transcript_70591/g.177961  ORF Transcript_70591/g.177961 Transcript_70591/m.177961 type:complete len:326 (+) Transcript_70591:3432-4409(+)
MEPIHEAVNPCLQQVAFRLDPADSDLLKQIQIPLANLHILVPKVHHHLRVVLGDPVAQLDLFDRDRVLVLLQDSIGSRASMTCCTALAARQTGASRSSGSEDLVDPRHDTLEFRAQGTVSFLMRQPLKTPSAMELVDVADRTLHPDPFLLHDEDRVELPLVGVAVVNAYLHGCHEDREQEPSNLRSEQHPDIADETVVLDNTSQTDNLQRHCQWRVMAECIAIASHSAFSHLGLGSDDRQVHGLQHDATVVLHEDLVLLVLLALTRGAAARHRRGLHEQGADQKGRGANAGAPDPAPADEAGAICAERDAEEHAQAANPEQRPTL